MGTVIFLIFAGVTYAVRSKVQDLRSALTSKKDDLVLTMIMSEQKEKAKMQGRSSSSFGEEEEEKQKHLKKQQKKFMHNRMDIEDILKDIADAVNQLLKEKKDSVADLDHARRKLKKHFLPFWTDPEGGTRNKPQKKRKDERKQDMKAFAAFTESMANADKA